MFIRVALGAGTPSTVSKTPYKKGKGERSYAIERWYNRREKCWVAMIIDEEGNQIGSSDYVYTRDQVNERDANFWIGNFKHMANPHDDVDDVVTAMKKLKAAGF